MKTLPLLLALAALPLAVFAADVSGTWKADFDTTRGLQKYTFTLKQDGTALTGKIAANLDGQNRESDVKEGKVDGDTVTFVETLMVPGRGGNFDSWDKPFENDLLKDIIPLIESKFSVLTDREHRALAGLSMGGGQTLNIGFAHTDVFGNIGRFSSAPNTYEFGGIYSGTKLMPDAEAAKKLKVLWIACGNKDGLLRVSQGVHGMLKAAGVPHVWNVDSHAHDTTEWDNNLCLFAQHIFK